jgi:hypothetical protein
MNTKQDNEDIGYLFNVEILIKNNSNAIALQSLIEMLNQNDHVIDFRIKSGIKLGGLIDTLLEMKKNPPISQTHIKNSSAPKPDKVANVEKVPVQIKEVQPQIEQPNSIAEPIDSNTNQFEESKNWIKLCIKDKRLVRLTTNRPGQPVNIPCRILNFDEERQYINVYHVDEKQVYTFNLNEIDSFSE